MSGGMRSRRKGSRGELEVVHAFNSEGFDCWRTPNSGGLSHSKGDINGIPGLHIEVKRAEQVRIREWIGQAEQDCAPHDIPIVVWRTSADLWRVDLPLTDFVPLWKFRTS